MRNTSAAAADGRAMTGGFADPVFHSQTVFRAVMDAFARPGTLMPLAALCAPPAPLMPATGAVALMLLDHDTAVWLDKPLKAAATVRQWLTFQTGTQIIDYAADAGFALAADPDHLPALESFSQGTQEYPDRSTTLLIQLPNLLRGPRWRLTGPGIETENEIRPSGLPRHFLAQWAANGKRFPRGVDLVLIAPEGIVCLPRTVRIDEKET